MSRLAPLTFTVRFLTIKPHSTSMLIFPQLTFVLLLAGATSSSQEFPTVITNSGITPAESAPPGQPIFSSPPPMPSPTSLQTTKKVVSFGDAEIRVEQTKNTAAQPFPFLCKATLQVARNRKVEFSRQYSDFGAVGFSYGLRVFQHPSMKGYVAVIKNGDYDGRLFLVDGSGVTTMLGGFLLFSPDGKLLFSEYASDLGGVSIFDLARKKLVFTSTDLPYVYQWYVSKDEVFFSLSEWSDHSGVPSEKAGITYWFDTKNNQFVRRNLSSDAVKGARKLDYVFDPRKYPSCKAD